MARHKDAMGLGADFVWLADMQETRKEPLYLDAVHYTADFARDIAEEIADSVLLHNSHGVGEAQPSMPYGSAGR
jgi:hypothetical protein